MWFDYWAEFYRLEFISHKKYEQEKADDEKKNP